MIKRKIDVDVDFSKKCGKVKPMCALVGGPVFDYPFPINFTCEYKELGAPMVRVAPTSDGGRAYIEVSRIFPDFSLDENFELSYDFSHADRAVLAAVQCGAGVFLSIGEGDDVRQPVCRVLPKERYEKWARVAGKIISHYNEGFASGYKLGIKYVEIMPGADRSPIFSDVGDFCEFYRVTANYLKKRFPRVKIGAYSSGGFRSLNHVDTSREEQSYVSFLDDFLVYIGKKNTHAPLDFLSWSCLAETPEELLLHTNYARSYLNHLGHKRAESIISEFNIYGAGDKLPVTDKYYPSLLASSMITAMKSDVAMMFYRDTHPYSPANFLYTVDDRTDIRYYAAYHVMRAFGELSSGKSTVVATGEDYRHEIYSLATVNETCAHIMLVTRNYDGAIELNLRGSEYTSYSIEGILGGGERGAGFSNRAEGIAASSKIALRVGRHEVYLLTLTK